LTELYGSMEAWSVLGYLMLGIVLGMIGQLVRVGIGYKKKLDEANAKGVNVNTLFDSKEILPSLMIAGVIGAAAGALGAIQILDQEINKETLITLLSIGYAGTDFIEGLLTKGVK
jgi:cell division protein FtsX